MRQLAPFVVAFALLSGPTAAQDLMGFDPASFGKVVLSQKQFGSDTQLERAFGDYNNEFISNYSPESVFAQLGLSVGRLDILTDSRNFPCTAFLVADDLLMTNHHCVPGILDNPEANATTIVAVQFMTGYVQEGVSSGTERFNVNPIPVETSKELDYSLLRVVGGKPGKQHGTLRLASLAPRDKDPFWIIGHPMGEAQRISREKCAANAPALSDNRLLHTCDTLPGNSGSPVIDASSQMVVALHHAGSRQNSVNYAIPMALILENSAILKAAFPDPDPTPDPEAEAFAALAAAMALDAAAPQILALRDVQTTFPGSRAATSAGQFLAVLDMPAVEPDAVPDLSAFPELGLAERMAINADVQQCDRLAGSPQHPDRATGAMTEAGTNVFDLNPGPAIAACEAALDTFPDHPRLLVFLGRVLYADLQESKAVQAYRKAAEQGDPIAQTNLGIGYEFGLGVPQSDTTAVSWYRKAAEQGNAVAQYSLGFMYHEGRGVPQSDTTAVSWYRKAAEQGNAVAQTNLGFMYHEGRGVPQSDTTAVSWYRKAAEQGYAAAQIKLGWMYANGRGVTKSPKLAVDSYIQALKGGEDWLLDRKATDWNPETAREMQQRLSALNLYDGAIDGAIGPQSRAAMRKLMP